MNKIAVTLHMYMYMYVEHSLKEGEKRELKVKKLNSQKEKKILTKISIKNYKSGLR